MAEGLLFDIQGHCLHDGPGTRTLFFFSGCPLRCRWCCNPEGLLQRPRLMYRRQLCKDCPSRCVACCPQGAVQSSNPGGPLVSFDRQQCDACDAMGCIDVCYTGALQRSGRWYTLDELVRLINRDRSYWGTDGGVTLTGGEPLMQREFALALLAACRETHVGTCVETSAYVPGAALDAVLPHTDWLFVDIKHMDPARHEEGTGVPNAPILDNLRRIGRAHWPGRLVVRVPVIPGYNDALENALATAEFLCDIGLKEINLLPFHRLGASKYAQLGMSYDYADLPATGAEELVALAAVYRAKSIACYLGADTPF
jgi:pyruvate formate lyase activating enzyme